MGDITRADRVRIANDYWEGFSPCKEILATAYRRLYVPLKEAKEIDRYQRKHYRLYVRMLDLPKGKTCKDPFSPISNLSHIEELQGYIENAPYRVFPVTEPYGTGGR